MYVIIHSNEFMIMKLFIIHVINSPMNSVLWRTSWNHRCIHIDEITYEIMAKLKSIQIKLRMFRCENYLFIQSNSHHFFAVSSLPAGPSPEAAARLPLGGDWRGCDGRRRMRRTAGRVGPSDSFQHMMDVTARPSDAPIISTLSN